MPGLAEDLRGHTFWFRGSHSGAGVCGERRRWTTTDDRDRAQLSARDERGSEGLRRCQDDRRPKTIGRKQSDFAIVFGEFDVQLIEG